MGESGCGEQYTFSNLENLLDLLFLCSLKTPNFRIKFCAVAELNIIYRKNFICGFFET
jgi:hypothetical protein